MKAQVLAAVLVFAPASAWAQGAIVETLEELRAVPEPPETRGPMPEKVDLSSGIPPPRSQGATSTCVSWAATYAAASHALRRSGGNVTLSPAYTYNLVSGNRFCHVGTSISKTLDFLRESGGLPIEEFAFDGGWCGRIPRDDERRRAQRYRIRGWSKFDARDPVAVKVQLARGVPVIFGMRIGAKLIGHRGDGVIEAVGEPFSGHAMVVVGYDDSRQAFRIQNSAGSGWGDRGYAWFAYRLWSETVQVGFVID